MPNLDHETRLCDALERAGREYRQAIDEMEALTTSLTSDTGRTKATQRLQRIAQRTRVTETNVSSLRETWQRAGLAPSGRLREVMNRQQTVLGELIQRIDAVEQAARVARDRLLPQFDANTRSHEMRSAYARSVRQAAE